MSSQITIIGLDRVGLSLGLALKLLKDPAECVGFDFDAARIKNAENLGAIDKPAVNVSSAVEKADVVLLNVPAGDIVDWLNEISPSLKEGAVVVNLAPVHRLANQWAADHLPAKRYLINVTPAISGSHLETDEPSETLFRGGIALVSSLPGMDEFAIQNGVDLAESLGSVVMFSDPFEADGFLSQVVLFPRLLALLYIQGVTSQPGWKEAQKSTGSSFWKVSRLLGELPVGKIASQEIIAQKENVLHMLDVLRDQIDLLHDEIQSADAGMLEKSIQQTLTRHDQWAERRITETWVEKPAAKEEKPAGMWKKMFGFGLPKKKP